MRILHKKLCLLMFLLTGCSLGIFAQNRTITGTVRDAVDVVIGASVTVKGNSSIGTITDMDGKFRISVPAFQHIAGDPGRRDLHQYDQGRGHTDRETHDDGDLCAAGRPRSRPRIGAQCVHRCEPEEFGHVHPREGDPHTGAQADAIRGRIGQHLPGVGSLPLFRHQGRRCEEQLHDVGAVYPGRVPLSARTQRYPGCLYIFQRMGCIGRPGTCGMVSGRSRRNPALLVRG